MSEQKHVMTYTGPVPDGWELTGEIRPAKKGEYFISFHVLPKQTHPGVEQAAYDSTCPVIIIRRKRWQPKLGENYWAIEIDSNGDSGVIMKKLCLDAVDVPNDGTYFPTCEAATKMLHKFFEMMREYQHE